MTDTPAFDSDELDDWHHGFLDAYYHFKGYRDPTLEQFAEALEAMRKYIEEMARSADAALALSIQVSHDSFPALSSTRLPLSNGGGTQRCGTARTVRRPLLTGASPCKQLGDLGVADYSLFA
jgi:hypothetical protein